MLEAREQAGKAADTGSAVHYAANVWHTKTGKDTRLAIGAMRLALEQFPFADLDEAESHFQQYARDPRNIAAKIVRSETKVEIKIPAKEGAEIVIRGRIDQIREEDGALYVHDIKTGQKEGWDMIGEAALQLAAYQIGGAQLLGKQIAGVRIIRTRDYFKLDRSRNHKPGPVFWECPWAPSECDKMLDSVRNVVAAVRRGEIIAAPGAANCQWCKLAPFPNCVVLNAA